MMAHAYLDGFYVTVDEEDSDLIERDCRIWYGPTSLYVQKRLRIGRRRKYVGLSHLILERKIGRKLIKGEMPDHKDRNSMNNCRNNLRIATRGQNNANRLGNKDREYPHGVRKVGRRYRAYIQLDGQQEHLGYFDTPEEASLIFQKRHAEIHGEFSPYYKEESA